MEKHLSWLKKIVLFLKKRSGNYYLDIVHIKHIICSILYEAYNMHTLCNIKDPNFEIPRKIGAKEIPVFKKTDWLLYAADYMERTD